MNIKFDIWRGNILSSYNLTESELKDIVFGYLVEIGHIPEEVKDRYEINIRDVKI